MEYKNIKEAVFLERPNRFIAYIEVDGKREVAHVKNTGRCRELLIPGCKIFVQENDLSHRKTKFDLISVYKGERLINMDSQAPNKVVMEWLCDKKLMPQLMPLTKIKAEAVYGSSRLDFYMEAGNRRIFAEVKGVTLEENGVVLFPDAPTERGIKHVNELCRCVEEGFDAYVIFVIQMKGVKHFAPNDKTHREFGDSLRAAKRIGVNVIAFDCDITPTEILYGDEVKVVI